MQSFSKIKEPFLVPSTIHHHPPSTIHHHPSVTTSGPWGLEPRGWKSDGYILEEPNKFSQKLWVLYAWVLITLNWEAFFSVFPSFRLSALCEIRWSRNSHTIIWLHTNAIRFSASSLKHSTCKIRKIFYKKLKYWIFITQSGSIHGYTQTLHSLSLSAKKTKDVQDKGISV